MIDWVRTEYAQVVSVILKDGEIFRGTGAGISLAEDFDDEDEAMDTFFIATKKGVIALSMEDIEDVVIVKP